MRAEVIANLPGYIAPNPINPASPLPGVQPLPPGATVEVVTTVQPDRKGWDLETFSKLVGQGADLAGRAGVDLGPLQGFDFGGAFGRIAASSGAGAVFGPWGAAIGAGVAVITVIADLSRRLNNPNWYAVGPGVHEWATAYAEGAFVGEAQAQGLDNWPDVQTIAAHQLAWWLDKFGAVLTGGGSRFYSGIPDSLYIDAVGGEAKARAIYEAAGVDYVQTKAARNARGNHWPQDLVHQYGIRLKAGSAIQVGGVVPVTVNGPVTPPLPGADTAWGGGAGGRAGLWLGLGLAAVGVGVGVASSK